MIQEEIGQILINLASIEDIDVPDFKVQPLTMQYGAAFQWWNSLIIFNEIYTRLPIFEPIIYHEFEHWYQYSVDRDKYLFWNPIPEATDEFYLECSNLGICPTEIDAYMFEQSLGKKNLRFLYRDISVQELEQYKQAHDLEGLKKKLILLGKSHK